MLLGVALTISTLLTEIADCQRANEVTAQSVEIEQNRDYRAKQFNQVEFARFSCAIPGNRRPQDQCDDDDADDDH